MRISTRALRSYTARVLAVLLLGTIYLFARDPARPTAELTRLAGRFSFRQTRLPESGAAGRNLRAVHPDLKHFGAWISTVGAAVALHDLDGDGLPNDICHVDPRSDEVVVSPAPGPPPRYQPFALEPSPLPYDPATTAPMGCLPGDFNEDGLADVLVYYWGRTPIAFLRRPAAGASGAGGAALAGAAYDRQEVSASAERWYTNAATLADLDGDGHTDLLIGNYFPDGARVLDARGGGREQMQDSMSLARNGGRNRFLLWQPPPAGAESSVRFVDTPGVADRRLVEGWTLAVGAADLDGDLLPELYFANDFGPDSLLHNRSQPGRLRFEPLVGARGLTTPKSKVLGRDSFKGMGVDFGDLNGDGWLDLYVSNIAEEYALEESHFVFLSTGRVESMRGGAAPYVDASEPLGLSRSGWGWDTRLADFDNDGVLEAVQATGFLKGRVDRWPELHELAMGNDRLLHDPRAWPSFQPGDDLSGQSHCYFFVRAADGRFYDLAAELGLDQARVSRGIATADTDADGRLDFAVANQWESSYFYRNESRDAGAFLGLRLRLPAGPAPAGPTAVTCGAGGEAAAPTRPAVGAQARVLLDGRAPLVAQVDGGNGHSGKRSPDLQFGLGAVAPGGKLTVELRWRDGQGQPQSQVLQLSPARWYTIRLGQGERVTNECE